MKDKFLSKTLVIGSFAMLLMTTGFAQEKEFVPVSAKEMTKLRKAVEANPDNLEAHKAYLAAFRTAEEATVQYEQWMKKYPKSAAVPQALAEKYGHYSPKTAQYLLQAAALEPDNVELWQELALDASMRGDNEKRIAYTRKAAGAQPQNINLQFAAVDLLKEDNETAWKQQTLELAKKYADKEETVSSLHMLGYNVSDVNEKIAIWELLKNMNFPLEKSQFAMSRLTDVYIQTGQYAKAIEMAKMFKDIAAGRLNFNQKLTLAETLAAADAQTKAGNHAAAKDLLMPLSMHSRGNLDLGSRIAIAKAAALQATGATQAAYDSLIVFQSLTPYPEVKDSLETYGSKLGKSAATVKTDVRAAVAGNSKAALPFELDTYPSGKKVKLEDYKGKVLLLSFWYPGCGPCRAEMPHIEAGIKNIDKNKMAYAGVNILRMQDDFVLPFINGTKYSFTPLGASEAIQKDYNIRYAPTNLIIDQDGRIAYSHFMINAGNEKMLEMMIQSLL